MARVQLSENHWSKIFAVLFAVRGPGRPAQDDRRFIEAVLWWWRTGVPWRDLPREFGPWKTVFNRFDRWSKSGRWSRLFSALQTDRDDEWHHAYEHLLAGLVSCIIEQLESRAYVQQSSGLSR